MAATDRIAAPTPTMLDINELLVSFEQVIEFLEVDERTLSTTNSRFEGVNKALVVLRQYQDELMHSQLNSGCE